ncbi:gas vesicle structural protein GvpA [Actinomadura sp. KC345]|uniref:gas vesicle protein GvpJ n=1 Tax=Actinomadura sp. KC345 TaxID=2530371 RepID=UPI001044812E|nr:gas vesicle protein GvpJ [Actinomadura sp. KC345]TDC41554.1 gas vesicle structural protein GvpA [Actinomadura sp. KC345]
MTGPVAQQTSGSNYVQRGGSGSSLADVIDLILEKGLVIDIYVRVSLVGIELLTIDVRIVVASVDTYLRFAEAVNRLDIANDGTQGLPQFLAGAQESGAKKKTRGALEGAGERLKETFGGEDDSEDDKQPARRRSSRKKEDEES